MPKRLFLLDGMALAYRAYFSLIRTPLINSKGMNTSAIYGFINTLNKLLEDEKPDYIAVAFDTDEPTFRHKQYDAYKAMRQAMPDDLIPQIDKIKEVISAFNIPMIEKHGFEADDIIGTLVKRAEKEKVLSFMVTGDKDFMQLINKNIKLYKPSRSVQGSKISDVEIIDEAGVVERFGVGPDKVADILGLMGDKVDNVPGVPGIGEKTATQLIQQFGSLENLYKNIDKVTKPKLKENLITHKENAFLSKHLATIDCDIPLDLDFHKLTALDRNNALLEKLYREFEFRTLLKKLQGTAEQAINIQVEPEAEEAVQVSPKGPLLDIKSNEHKYYTIKNDADFKKLVEKLKTVDEFSFDIEANSEDPFTAELVGLSFSYDENEGFYVPFIFKEQEEKDLFGKTSSGDNMPDINKELALREIKPVLEDKKIRKIGQNIKYDMLVMKNYGIDLQNVGFDTMVAAYVLKPESNYKMDYLAEAYLNYRCIPLADVLIASKPGHPITMAEVPWAQASEFEAEDADVTLRLYHRLEYELKKISLDNLCRDIEFPLDYVNF